MRVVATSVSGGALLASWGALGFYGGPVVGAFTTTSGFLLGSFAGAFIGAGVEMTMNGEMMNGELHKTGDKTRDFVTSIFKPLLGPVLVAVIVNLIFAASFSAIVTLSIITLALSGNPIQFILIKCTLLFAACFGLFTVGTYPINPVGWLVGLGRASTQSPR